MERFALPLAILASIAVALGVMAGLLPALPTVPLTTTLLVTLVGIAVAQPSLRLFGPALGRADSPGQVALTFDDGPDPEGTPAVLDALDAAGMKATFFVVGERAQRHPDLLRDIAARGHEVGNHSMHHRWAAILTRRGAERELDEAQAVLSELLGAPPALYRPPFGLVTPFVFRAAEKAEVTVAAWSLRTLDGTNPEASAMLKRLDAVRSGDVVLLHDGAGPKGKSPSPEAIDRILETLRARGLRSVTMSDLFQEVRPGAATRARAIAVGVRLALLLLFASPFLP